MHGAWPISHSRRKRQWQQVLFSCHGLLMWCLSPSCIFRPPAQTWTNEIKPSSSHAHRKIIGMLYTCCSVVTYQGTVTLWFAAEACWWTAASIQLEYAKRSFLRYASVRKKASVKVLRWPKSQHRQCRLYRYFKDEFTFVISFVHASAITTLWVHHVIITQFAASEVVMKCATFHADYDVHLSSLSQRKALLVKHKSDSRQNIFSLQADWGTLGLYEWHPQWLSLGLVPLESFTRQCGDSANMLWLCFDLVKHIPTILVNLFLWQMNRGTASAKCLLKSFVARRLEFKSLMH